MLRIYFTALGCKLNQAEVETYARATASHRMEITNDLTQADWAVINTCTVTQTASQKSRQAIRHLSRTNPSIRIAVIGCYATISPKELYSLPGVELLLPNANKDQVLAEISAASGKQEICVTPPASFQSNRTRAQVKIQDGCDNACTYCIVHIARGAQRSRLPEQVLAEVRQRVAEGYQEVVLTGVHIGAYGRDSATAAQLTPEKSWNLARLVRLLLAETPVPRLRLSSIEPWDVSADLLALWPDERLCRHLHLPIQSGSDQVLERMGRNYTRGYLEELITRIRSRVPAMAITTDLIAGFPGESEQDHHDTCAFIQRIGLGRLHVFAYSARPGTPAAAWPDQVASETIKRRSQELSALGRQLNQDARRNRLGQELRVLFENSRDRQGQRLWSGLTDDYVRVYAASTVNLHNTFGVVKGSELYSDGILGEVITP